MDRYEGVARFNIVVSKKLGVDVEDVDSAVKLFKLRMVSVLELISKYLGPDYLGMNVISVSFKHDGLYDTTKVSGDIEAVDKEKSEDTLTKLQRMHDVITEEFENRSKYQQYAESFYEVCLEAGLEFVKYALSEYEGAIVSNSFDSHDAIMNMKSSIENFNEAIREGDLEYAKDELSALIGNSLTTLFFIIMLNDYGKQDSEED